MAVGAARRSVSATLLRAVAAPPAQDRQSCPVCRELTAGPAVGPEHRRNREAGSSGRQGSPAEFVPWPTAAHAQRAPRVRSPRVSNLGSVRRPAALQRGTSVHVAGRPRREAPRPQENRESRREDREVGQLLSFSEWRGRGGNPLCELKQVKAFPPHAKVEIDEHDCNLQDRIDQRLHDGARGLGDRQHDER